MLHFPLELPTDVCYTCALNVPMLCPCNLLILATPLRKARTRVFCNPKAKSQKLTFSIYVTCIKAEF